MNYVTQLRSGFSLIEITIVLVVIGFLSMGALNLLTLQSNYERIKRTERTLDEIVEAIYGFVVIYGRMPCADTDFDGVEDCSSIAGKLPWKDLGVGRYDAWGQQFYYAVDNSLISAPLPSNPALDELSIKIGLNDSEPIFIPALIWSEGKTFSWAPRSDCEIENADNDLEFVICKFVENKYDDILQFPIWDIIMTRLVAAGKWPP